MDDCTLAGILSAVRRDYFMVVGQHLNLACKDDKRTEYMRLEQIRRCF